MSATVKDKRHAHIMYQHEVDDIIDDIAGARKVKVTRGNTAVSRELQRYALVRMARQKLDRVHDYVRAQVLNYLPVPQVQGQYLLYDNPYVSCVAQVRPVPGKLDDAAVLDMMVTKFNITEAQAIKLLDKCRTEGTLSTELTVTLKK